MHQINILIVEDEILLAQDLQIRLQKSGKYKTHTADSFDEAIKVLLTTKIDFLIIDITLKGDKSGIDLAKKVNEKLKLPFLFLTSHADQVTFEQAKVVCPSAYLLKPFNDREISMSIDLALSNFNQQTLEEDSEPNEEAVQEYLFLKKDNAFQKVMVEDIIYLEAQSNYTYFHTKTEKFMYAIVLKKIIEKLPQDQFIRVHRSFVVNKKCITGFSNNAVTLDEHYEVPVSKQNKEMVFKLFNTV
ncbi:LytR/AlgR family response regulator transcription factor [Flammeovirga agarivorans]|uniref:Response regulator transcription factor n=1 Tax=Flammeovirga agarivorans TaxID=2726742 RepID=A0A7X8SKU3_9BACT|nr:LytTR family transcriptional regulator DNA-binding domain-containing protein [Flammeovirga agarivorans]NLR92096.1 response regulator transcription factor [Flammeovirga agarivorans]